MITLALFVVSQLPSDESAARERALDAVFLAAGVSRAASDAPREATFHAAGFEDAAWSEPAGALEFSALPGATPYFGSARPAVAAAAACMASLAPPTWGDSQPTLVLEQQGEQALARGRVLLRPSRGAGPNADQPWQLRSVSSGCALTSRFELPLQIPLSGVELEFEWDLHSPVLLDNRRLEFELDGGVFPSVPLELRAPACALQLEPRRLTFDTSDRASANVRIVGGRSARLERVVHPACVTLLSTRVVEDGWELEFAESGLNTGYHECNAVRVDVVLDGDPQPFQRFLGVRHTRLLQDELGQRVLWSSFAPGERVEVWSDGRRLRLAHADRIPCCAQLLSSFGFRSLGALEIPGQAGWVDRLVTSPAGAVRVVGLAQDSLSRSLEAWSELCER